MKAIEVQLHTFLLSEPDTFERSTADRLEALD
jgi:hypothetical protein